MAKRKTEESTIVAFFQYGELAKAETLLEVAKSIVQGRQPKTTATRKPKAPKAVAVDKTQ